VFSDSVRRRILISCLALCALLALAPAAHARGTKAIWGPAKNASDQPNPGASLFPTYRQLGVDVYEFHIPWDQVAATQPADPRNPLDPAYNWSSIYDFIVSESAANGIALAAQVHGAPSWANGGRSAVWAPSDPQDLADFMYAASLRFPSIKRWMVWGEPGKGDSFQPQGAKRAPRLYAKLLAAAYPALKQASPSNTVIGGMTHNGGNVKPPIFIRNMKLKNGKVPPMDLYGHNPFDPRAPKIKQDPIGKFRGLNDVDTLWKEIKAAYGRQKKGRPKGLFLSEFTVQSDHDSGVFAFHVTREEQAKRLTGAFKLARKLKYVNTLGWFSLYDYPDSADNPAWGLLTYEGQMKPAFSAYAAVP
jgi:hypothetical protein